MSKVQILSLLAASCAGNMPLVEAYECPVGSWCPWGDGTCGAGQWDNPCQACGDSYWQTGGGQCLECRHAGGCTKAAPGHCIVQHGTNGIAYASAPNGAVCVPSDAGPTCDPATIPHCSECTVDGVCDLCEAPYSAVDGGSRCACPDSNPHFVQFASGGKACMTPEQFADHMQASFGNTFQSGNYTCYDRHGACGACEYNVAGTLTGCGSCETNFQWDPDTKRCEPKEGAHDPEGRMIPWLWSHLKSETSGRLGDANFNNYINSYDINGNLVGDL